MKYIIKNNCYIDHKKSFYNLLHKDLFALIGKLDLLRNKHYCNSECLLATKSLHTERKFVELVHKNTKGFFSQDLFNSYSGTILRELNVLPGFIAGEHNLNNIIYAHDSMLMVDA